MKNYACLVIVSLIIHGLCYLTGKGVDNAYTKRHFAFNQHCSSLMIQFGVTWFFSYFTYNNCGIRFRFKCADYTLTAFFVFWRILLGILMLKNVFYDMPVVLVEGWSLNYTNYWTEKDKYRTFTSASFVNSFMSWIFFFMLLQLTLVLSFILICITIGVC